MGKLRPVHIRLTPP